MMEGDRMTTAQNPGRVSLQRRRKTNHWNSDGDLVVETRTLFRQVGWQGHRAGDFYSMDSHPQDTEPGGFSPVYVQVGD